MPDLSESGQASDEKSDHSSTGHPAFVSLRFLCGMGDVSEVCVMPLYRQEKEWKSIGLDLSRATLANWMIATTRDWLKPLVNRLHELLVQERYLHADETP